MKPETHSISEPIIGSVKRFSHQLDVKYCARPGSLKATRLRWVFYFVFLCITLLHV